MARAVYRRTFIDFADPTEESGRPRASSAPPLLRELPEIPVSNDHLHRYVAALDQRALGVTNVHLDDFESTAASSQDMLDEDEDAVQVPPTEESAE
eukprot:Skav210361  [mRNA]  locus=scaffold1357:6347:12536:+ [translate_table: standard]